MSQVGPPTTGTWRLGTIACDAAGVFWRCSAGGSPGTWVALVPASGPTATPGEIRAWVGMRSTVPAGWLICDGAALSRATYAALFATLCPSYAVSAVDVAANTLALTAGAAAVADLVTGTPMRVAGASLPGGLSAGTTVFAIPGAGALIRVASSLANALAGTAIDLTSAGGAGLTVTAVPHGAGDGVSTFTLPDLRRRALVGAEGAGTATLAAHVGAAGGAETHILSVAEMPAHTHRVTTATGTGGSQTYHDYRTNGATMSSVATISSTGGGGAHNNLPPSLGVHWIIRVLP